MKNITRTNAIPMSSPSFQITMKSKNSLNRMCSLSDFVSVTERARLHRIGREFSNWNKSFMNSY